MTTASAAPSATNSPSTSPRLKPSGASLLHLQAINDSIEDLDELDLNKQFPLNQVQETPVSSRPITPPPEVDLENLEDVRNSKDASVIQNARVHFRCRISELYAGLLRCQRGGNHERTSATHDWSLGNIQTITDDLLDRVPNHLTPENNASYFFTTHSTPEVKNILELLSRAIKNHDLVNSMHEQLNMGTL